MNNIKAIFIKQITSLLKNPVLIINGIIFLAIAGAFLIFLSPEDEYDCHSCIPAYICATCQEEEDNRFQLPTPSQVGLFAVIFIGLGLMGSASAQVNEDKTTTNLRFMAMAEVRPYQYLLGTVTAMIIVVAIMLVPYALLGGYFGTSFFRFMTIGIFGGLTSILLGIVIGLSKIPIIATPLSILMGMGPAFSTFNERVANLLRFTFIQQVNIAFSDLEVNLSSSFLIIGANFAIVLLVFIVMHRKNRFNL
ncbi:MAG: hypothetical protein FWD03_02320 [Defluviitaleaceae bacterium]|nr:hypothetical protein [Defluviitaleaceae bacterium]